MSGFVIGVTAARTGVGQSPFMHLIILTETERSIIMVTARGLVTSNSVNNSLY